MEVCVDTVQDLVVAADMLQIADVVLVCGNFLSKELCPTNAIGIYRYDTALTFPQKQYLPGEVYAANTKRWQLCH